MSRNAVPNTFMRENTARMNEDAGYLNHVAMSNFGMDAQTLDSVLNVMMAVSQGNMPSGQHMAPVYQMAQQKYGWGKDRVQAELRTAISQATPQERIAAYLSANNNERVDPAIFAKAANLVQHGLRGDLEASIYNRLNENKSNNSPRDQFSGMQASERVLADSRDKADLRSRLEALSGHKPAQSYEDRVHRVLKARSELADRVEAKALSEAAGHEPSLRESLADSYDLAAVTSASEDIGLGNPIDEAASAHEADSGHLAENYDVTAGLRD